MFLKVKSLNYRGSKSGINNGGNNDRKQSVKDNVAASAVLQNNVLLNNNSQNRIRQPAQVPTIALDDQNKRTPIFNKT